MEKTMAVLLYILVFILVVWGLLSLITQYLGSADKKQLRSSSPSEYAALILYNPDPFYNFDEQVCNSIGNALISEQFEVDIIPVSQFEISQKDYHLIIFCANTYNFAPDWKIQSAIKNFPTLEGKYIANISLGAGTTSKARMTLDKLVESKNGRILNSSEYWLKRPNDKSRMEENNVEVAKEMVYKVGKSLGNEVKSFY